MPKPARMDYSKLLGFDMVADEAADGVDFQQANIGAKLGAKVGKATAATEAMRPIDPQEAANAGAAIMLGVGGRTVASS